MKITKRQLRRIIKEERQRILREDTSAGLQEVESDLMVLKSDLDSGNMTMDDAERIDSVAQALGQAIFEIRPMFSGLLSDEEFDQALQQVIQNGWHRS